MTLMQMQNPSCRLYIYHIHIQKAYIYQNRFNQRACISRKPIRNSESGSDTTEGDRTANTQRKKNKIDLHQGRFGGWPD